MNDPFLKKKKVVRPAVAKKEEKMTLKAKLTSCIMAFVMIVSVLCVGVWALKTTNFEVGGNIVFKTKGIEATITDATLTGATTTNGTTIGSSSCCKDITITPDTTEENLESEYSTWQGLGLQFSDLTATLTFTVQNTKTYKEGEDYQYMSIEVSTNQTSMTNADIQVTNTNGGNKIYLAPGDSTTYTISFFVNDKAENASINGFTVNFNMLRMETAPTESTVQLSYQAAEGYNDAYYYVEMGTYNSSPVRWRVASFDGVTRAVASKSTPPTMYTAVSGDSAYKNVVFVQQTYTKDFAFDESYTSNDYAISPIRTYLKNTATTADGSTSYRGDLGIPTTSSNAYTKIYNKIQTRKGGATATTATSLYDDINWDYSTYAVSDGTPSTTDSNTDKFWLMSVKEAWTMIGGGRIIDGKANWVWSEDSQECKNLIWRQNSTDEYGVYYWLRSPNPSGSDLAFSVGYNGDWGSYIVADTYAVRPAFNLNF